MTVREYLPEYCCKSTLILGCGNILLGDDGFGPRVIEYLRDHYPIPEDVALLDAGTGVREILLDIALSDTRPERILIVDALDCGKEIGKLSMLALEDIPQRGIKDLSLHQVPTSALLKEVKELGKVEVTLLTVQPESIPKGVNPELSPPVQEAVPKASTYIVENLF